MKVRHFVLVLGAAAAAVITTAAAQTWQSKPFNTWTDVELKEVISSSPWAGRANITYEQTGRNGPIRAVALVSWSSALPLREAAERGKYRAGTAVLPAAEARIAAATDAYVIRVVVTRGVRPADFASQSAMMRAQTSLRRDGKPPLRPSQIDGLVLDRNGKILQTPGGPRDAALLLVFTFPKTPPLTLDDVEAEFVTKLCTSSVLIPDVDAWLSEQSGPLPPQCNLNVKKTFKLKEMVYHGVLAL
jgi:hypothetical protein